MSQESEAPEPSAVDTTVVSDPVDAPQQEAVVPEKAEPAVLPDEPQDTIVAECSVLTSEVTAEYSEIERTGNDEEVEEEGYQPDISRQTSMAFSDDGPPSPSQPPRSLDSSYSPEVILTAVVGKIHDIQEEEEDTANHNSAIENLSPTLEDEPLGEEVKPLGDEDKTLDDDNKQKHNTNTEEGDFVAVEESIADSGAPVGDDSPEDATTDVIGKSVPALMAVVTPVKSAPWTKNNEDAKLPAASDQDDGIFVNHGLALWEQKRQQWLDHANRTERQRSAATPIEVDDIIDVIFASSRQVREEGGPRKFPKNVPLPQMVDILQDLWEAEGLDA